MSTGSKASGFQRVISDIADLCELQWQLISVDGQEAKRRAVKAGILLAASIVAVSAAILAAVLAAGWLVHDQFGFSVGSSFALVSAVLLVLTVIAGFIGVRMLRQANESLSEAKREFSENVRWIKEVVLQPDSSPRSQLRAGSFSPEFVDPSESRFQHFR